MRVHAEQDALGIVIWDPPEIELELLEIGEDGAILQTTRLSDPDGSLVPGFLRRFAFREIESNKNHGEPRIRLLNRDGVRIWERRGQAERFLRYLPDDGVFQRTLVDAGWVDWALDTTFFINSTVVRLTNQPLEAEVTRPLDSFGVGENGEITLTGPGSRAATLSGRLIEVIADGADRHEAAMRTEAVLGLLQLIFGPASVRQVVAEEYYEAGPDGQLGWLEFPSPASIPRRIPAEELTTFEDTLTAVAGNGAWAPALGLALQWFRRGEESLHPRDKFLAYFIAIERLVTSLAASHSPLPAEVERETLVRQVIASIGEWADASTCELVRNRLSGSSLRERFVYYRERRALAPETLEQFGASYRFRNDLFHGRLARVDSAVARSTRALLITMLKAELGVSGQMAWEQLPSVADVRVQYELRPSAH